MSLIKLPRQLLMVIKIKNKNNKIKNLTKNNEALNLRVKTLNNTIKEIDNEDICFRWWHCRKEKDDFER